MYVRWANVKGLLESKGPPESQLDKLSLTKDFTLSTTTAYEKGEL